MYVAIYNSKVSIQFGSMYRVASKLHCLLGCQLECPKCFLSSSRLFELACFVTQLSFCVRSKEVTIVAVVVVLCCCFRYSCMNSFQSSNVSAAIASRRDLRIYSCSSAMIEPMWTSIFSSLNFVFSNNGDLRLLLVLLLSNVVEVYCDLADMHDDETLLLLSSVVNSKNMMVVVDKYNNNAIQSEEIGMRCAANHAFFVVVLCHHENVRRCYK